MDNEERLKTVTEFVDNYKSILKQREVEPLSRDQEGLLVAYVRGDLTATKVAQYSDNLLDELLDMDILASVAKPHKKGTRVINGICTIFFSEGKAIGERPPYTNRNALEAYKLMTAKHKYRHGYRNVGIKTIKTLENYLKAKGLLRLNNSANFKYP